MLKNYILSLALCITLMPLGSAQVKEAFLQPKTFSASETVCSLGNRIYLNVATDGYFETYPLHQSIVKLDLQLNVLDSLNVSAALSIHSGHYLYCPKMRQTDINELTAVLTEIDEDSINTTQQIYFRTHVLQFDTNLVVKNHFTIGDTADFVRFVEVKKHNDSLYFLGFRYSTFNKKIYQQIVKTNGDGSSQSLYEFHDSIFGYNYFFNHIEWYKDKILIGMDANYGALPNIGIFSKQFNLIKKASSYSPIDSTSLKPWSGFFVPQGNNPPITIGTSVAAAYSPATSFNMAVSHLDSNLNLSQIDTFKFSGKDYRYYNNPRAWFDAFDYNTTDSVLLVMAGQMMDPMFYNQSDSNDIYIYNYNGTTHQLNWLKVYNSGYNNSMMAAGEVLPGNRYLVVLNEYNWDKMAIDNMAVHLMILNYKGDILSETKLKVPSSKPKVYPNPVSTFLNIELPTDKNITFNYKLIGMDGKTLLSGQLSLENSKIDFRQVPSGTYFLKVKDGKNQFVYTIIKE